MNLCTCTCRHCIACIFKLINNWICIVFVNRDFWLITHCLSLSSSVQSSRKVQTHQPRTFFPFLIWLHFYCCSYLTCLCVSDSKSYLCIERVTKGLSNGFYGKFYNLKNQQVKFILKKCWINFNFFLAGCYAINTYS